MAISAKEIDALSGNTNHRLRVASIAKILKTNIHIFFFPVSSEIAPNIGATKAMKSPEKAMVWLHKNVPEISSSATNFVKYAENTKVNMTVG